MARLDLEGEEDGHLLHILSQAGNMNNQIADNWHRGERKQQSSCGGREE